MLIESLMVVSSMISTGVEDYCLAFCKGERLEIAQANTWEEKAYEGAFLCLKAEEVLSPFDKYAYFKEGTKLIDQAVKAEPESFHPRFIRYVIQYQTPAFLMYKDNLEEDAKFLREFYQNQAAIFSPAIQEEIKRVFKELELL